MIPMAMLPVAALLVMALVFGAYLLRPQAPRARPTAERPFANDRLRVPVLTAAPAGRLGAWGSLMMVPPTDAQDDEETDDEVLRTT